MVTREMDESLDRLGLEYADLYLMHRDNPAVPVGEFVDCLNGHREAGRISAYGGSNWTTARLQAANEYATAHGVPGFAASSPNFSLAHWNEPMWGGCLTAVDPASRAWYARTRCRCWPGPARPAASSRAASARRRRGGGRRGPRLVQRGNWERLRRAQEVGRSTASRLCRSRWPTCCASRFEHRTP